MISKKTKKTVADYPHLVEQWHQTRNGENLPEDFTYGSKKSVWWVCPLGHEYEAAICNRTGRNSGCKQCANAAPKPWSKNVQVNGENFETITAAARHFNISTSTLEKYMREAGTAVIDLPDNYASDKRFKNNKSHETGSFDYLKELAEANGFSKPDDWYDAYREGALPSQFSLYINKHWDGDWVRFLEALYEGSEIQFWRLKRLPLSIWRDHSRVNQYLDWLGEKLNFTSLDDWYGLKTDDILKNYGDGLYKCYGSIFEILKIRFPNKNVMIWKVSKVPSGTWENKDLHKSYIDYLADELGFKEGSDWYSISSKDFQKYGGRSILKQYETLVDCLRANLPELNLLPWKFDKAGRLFWTSFENRRWFVEWMVEQMNIQILEDYYSISERHFIEYGGVSCLSYHNSSPAKCIAELLPELELDEAEFDKASKGQLNLYRYLKFRYPHFRMIYNYKHPSVVFADSNRRAEIDIFFPDISVGIEVQGAQHYRPAWGGDVEFEKIKFRDKEKLKKFRDLNLKIHEIQQTKMPMAWDKLSIFLETKYPDLIEQLTA